MATKKEPATIRYVVLRDFGGNLAGDIIELSADSAALLIRDGLIAPYDQEG